MANHHASDFNTKPLHMSAYGNAWADDYSLTATLANGDKAYLGVLPAGLTVYSVRLQHHAAGASTTAKLGFEPMDGDDPTADDDYWLAAATSVATAGEKASTAAPLVLTKPVKVVLTAGGADFAAGTLRLIVSGKCVGVA